MILCILKIMKIYFGHYFIGIANQNFDQVFKTVEEEATNLIICLSEIKALIFKKIALKDSKPVVEALERDLLIKISIEYNGNEEQQFDLKIFSLVKEERKIILECGKYQELCEAIKILSNMFLYSFTMDINLAKTVLDFIRELSSEVVEQEQLFRKIEEFKCVKFIFKNARNHQDEIIFLHHHYLQILDLAKIQGKNGFLDSLGKGKDVDINAVLKRIKTQQ